MEAATASGDEATRTLAADGDMVMLFNQRAMAEELLENPKGQMSAQSLSRLARMHGDKHPSTTDALHESAEFLNAVYQVAQLG